MEKVISKLLGLEISKLEDCSGLNTAKEIIQQPDTWRESVKNLIKNKIEIKSFIDSFLSKKEFRIILTGAGTSAFAGEVCEPYLTSLLNKRVEAIATTDLVASPKSYFIKDIPTLLVSFARSGNSPESVHAVNLASQLVDDLYQIVITCNENGKLAKNTVNDEKSFARSGNSPESVHAVNLASQLVDDLYQIVITCNENGKLAKNTVNDEKSLLLLMPPQTNDLGFAMTSSFTTMVLNAMAVFNIDNIENFSSDVDKLSNSVNDFIENNIEKVTSLANEDFERIVYLGSSTSKGIARESALKVLELTAGKVNASYDTPLGFRHGPKSVVDDETVSVIYISNDEYTRKYDLDLAKEMLAHKKNDTPLGFRHGPKSVVDDETVSVIYISNDEYTRKYDLDLAKEMLAHKKNDKVVIVGDNIEEDILNKADYVFNVENINYTVENEVLLPLQQIIFGQMLSFLKSVNLGITPDNPCPTGEVNRVVQGVILHELV